MDGNDIAQARAKLGELWGLDRPLSAKELARALGLSPRNGDDHVRNMESGKSAVSGTIELLLRMYLGGAVPPDDVTIFEFVWGEESGAARVGRPPGRPKAAIDAKPIEAEGPLSPNDVAEAIGLSLVNLGKMRSRGTGPKFTKSETGRITYEVDDVNAWLAEQKASREAASA